MEVEGWYRFNLKDQDQIRWIARNLNQPLESGRQVQPATPMRYNIMLSVI
jgi:hypothetical protein